MYKLHDFNQIPFYSKVQGVFINLIEIMQLVHFYNNLLNV